jgi:hypothetical protein
MLSLKWKFRFMLGAKKFAVIRMMMMKDGARMTFAGILSAWSEL